MQDNSTEQIMGVRSRGKFRCRWRGEKFAVIIMLVVMLVGAVVIFRLVDTSDYRIIGYFEAFWVAFCVWMIRIAQSGVTYRYEADADVFRITDNRNRTECFFYSELMNVRYEPINKLRGGLRGYHVMITTKYGVYSYDYIAYWRAKISSPEDTPFFILERCAENAGSREET